MRILSDLKIYGYSDNAGNNGADDSSKSEGFVVKGDGALTASKAGEITYKREVMPAALHPFIDALLQAMAQRSVSL